MMKFLGSSVKASVAAAAVGALILVAPLSASAAQSGGIKSCSSLVRLYSTVAGASSVTHSWSAAGGSAGYVQWFTNGTHNNLTSHYYLDWLVTTAGGSISSAYGSCSGIA